MSSHLRQSGHSFALGKTLTQNLNANAAGDVVGDLVSMALKKTTGTWKGDSQTIASVLSGKYQGLFDSATLQNKGTRCYSKTAQLAQRYQKRR